MNHGADLFHEILNWMANNWKTLVGGFTAGAVAVASGWWKFMKTFFVTRSEFNEALHAQELALDAKLRDQRAVLRTVVRETLQEHNRQQADDYDRLIKSDERLRDSIGVVMTKLGELTGQVDLLIRRPHNQRSSDGE